MRVPVALFVVLLLSASLVYGASKVLIVPPAWEGRSLKSFAREISENCEDLVPAIDNAEGYCADTALSAAEQRALRKCRGDYRCLKRRIVGMDEYDVIILSSLSKKRKVPYLKVALYDPRGDLLYSERLEGERDFGPEETASLYLTALRNARDVFVRPASKQAIKQALRKGFALYKKGELRAAMRQFERAGGNELLRLTSDVEDFMGRATVGLKNGDLFDAIGDLQRALEKDADIRAAGYKVISYIKETEKTKRSDFDNSDFYDDLLKIHGDFERRYQALEKKRAEEERAIEAREKKKIRAIEKEIESARREIEKGEEKMGKDRAALDEEIKRLLAKQDKGLEVLNNKRDKIRRTLDRQREGRNVFSDKVERRADELRTKEIEKLQARFLKEQEAIMRKISALERKDPPDEKAIRKWEKKIAELERNLEKGRTAVGEKYRKGAEEHMKKYDKKIIAIEKKLAAVDKEEAALLKKTQATIDGKEAALKKRFEQWKKERKKREALVAKMVKNSEKRIAAAGREAQAERKKLGKRLAGERDTIMAAEKKKISKRYTSRFVPVFKRVIERTAATRKIRTMLGEAYARLGDQALKGDDLPEARRHYHRALFHDPKNRSATKGVDLVRKRAVELYETAMAMSEDDHDRARQTLETIINSLRPTSPIYLKAFIALRERKK